MKPQSLSPMEEALERERHARKRELAAGTPAVLNALAEHVRRPKNHSICATCRRPGLPDNPTDSSFDVQRCQCDSPDLVSTFW